MTGLAGFLEAERESIVALFTARVRANFEARGLTQAELRDDVPSLLAELGRSLAEAGTPADADVASSAPAEAHGRQRRRVGYEIDALVEEYGLLHDCILQRIEEVGARPRMSELRTLAIVLSKAAADSARQYAQDRAADLEVERIRLLGFFQQAPGFVCLLRGREQVFELANAAYYQLVGHRDILGRAAREALPELEGQGYFELLDRVFTSGEAFVGRGLKVEVQRTPAAPPTEAWVDLIYQPIRGADGAVAGILVQGHDVTEVARLEAARRASEERYRGLFESIDDGFCVIEMIFDGDRPVDYRFLETNDAFEAHTGLGGAVGRRVLELVPDLDPSWAARYGRVATTGAPARFEDYVAPMARWFDVYASRVGPAGLGQVAVLLKDVTARKRAEAERDRLHAMERAARREAEQAGRLKDEFLATVSHELRTPLTAMLGWVQMLRAGSLSPEKQARALETVERNGRAQAQIIDDLLDVSRILAGKLRLEVEPVEVKAIVEAALAAVRPAADAKALLLEAALVPGTTVMGDPHRLQQVVWNLLSNAVKFTPRGGRVEVLVAARDSSVEVTVADAGQGIAPDFRDHVFERFRQADGSTTRAHGGLGVGLSIVRQLVEMHGGTVSVFSEGEGRGARFTVRLPRASLRPVANEPSPDLRAVPPPAEEAPLPSLAGLSLVVVDDEEDIRELLRVLLEGRGARVSVASSAAEALRLVAADHPDVLVADIGMPGEDGYALVEKVRALPRASGGGVPAVALTAYVREEDRRRALEAGFDAHVGKPVDPAELLEVIAALARGAAADRPAGRIPPDAR